jgi:hypothetical protein
MMCSILLMLLPSSSLRLFKPVLLFDSIVSVSVLEGSLVGPQARVCRGQLILESI